LGGLLTLGMAEMDWARATALVLIGAAALVLPIYMLNLWGATVLVEIQPRYFLSLVLIGVTLAVLRLPRPTGVWDRGQVVFLVLLATVSHTVALNALLRRYVAGQDVPSIGLNRITEWWWGLPGGPDLVWAAGSAAYLALLALLGWQVSRAGGERQSHEVADLSRPAVAAEEPGGLPVPLEAPQGA
jgi:hypothetical protein